MKYKINSSQYSYFFGDKQIHFPYSIASVLSYSNQDEEIRNNFTFEKVFVVRDDVESDIKKSQPTDILLCSCYSWNWEITNILARKVKENNPNCWIIFGGPEVPDEAAGFFDRYRHVDIIVHGEGEIVLHNILKAFLKKEDIKNITINGTETKYNKGLPQDRITDLDIIPSPYSTNFIWEIVEKTNDIKYIASWETNRGCPFQCTFCDWGSATKTKLRNFSEEKLYKEIEWFGENKIIYVDCCDGNFGIFNDRDYRLSCKLVEAKKKTGFPERINLTWVKSSSEKVIPLAKKLEEAKLLRAVSLSVQSLDDNTLKIIKRANIKFDKFESLTKRFDDEGIQSYTELIMGLPGETLQTFKNNWEILASIYPQPSILVWNCSVFVNAPMNNENYKKVYGIQVFTSPMFMQHSSPNKNEIKEYEKMVNATNSLPPGEIHKVYLYNWTMMVFNAFGILEFVSRYFNKIGMTYTEFYEKFIKYCEDNNCLFSTEMFKTKQHADNGYGGMGWDHYDNNLGDISFPLEEASWLRLTRDKVALHDEITKFVYTLDYDKEILHDLCKFQTFILNFPEDRSKTSVEEDFKYNWSEVFNNGEIQKRDCKYSKTPPVKEPDLVRWGYEIIWFGRRLQRYKTKIKDIRELRPIDNSSWDQKPELGQLV